MEMGFTTAIYVVAIVLFILSLGGLSGQESAKRAVWYGIVAMALAVSVTLFGPGFGLWWLSLILIAAGGLVGYQLASRVEMTQMPELVAGMHALVGLVAVFVGFNTHFELINIASMDDSVKKTLEGFSGLLAKKSDVEISILRVESSLGIWIGAVTFMGSIIAYGKLAGKVTSAATKLPGGNYLNATAAILSVIAMIWYLNSGELSPIIILTILAVFIGYHLIMGIGGADMPVVVSMLNSYSGWAAAAIGFSLGNDLLIVVGALVGSSGAILSYIMCKAMNRSFVSVILGGFGEYSGPQMEIEVTTKKPQLKQAKAALEVAKAQVQSAEKKLNKTEITAPYTGRIQNINIDLGSTIIPGQPVGSMYTSNEIEVTLSVKDSDLQFLDIPMDGRKLNPDQKSIVVIKSLYKGEMQEWAGNLERVDGVIDPMTRMIKLIANFKNNFIEETKPILPIGLFVEAEINGKQLEDIFMIPNSALTPNDELLFLNQDDALEIRKVSILTKMKNHILVKEGMKAGERVVVSKLSIATNGMLVNPRYQ